MNQQKCLGFCNLAGRIWGQFAPVADRSTSFTPGTGRFVGSLGLCLLGLVASPGTAGIAVIGGLSREAVLQPGGKTEGRIMVRNSGDQPQQVKAYRTEPQLAANGARSWQGSTPVDCR